MFDGKTCRETLDSNVIDIDVDERRGVLRKTIRAMNATAEDPVKQDRHACDLEHPARRLKQLQSAA